MISGMDDYVRYRLSKAEEALEDADLLARNGSWNACINRLYYACFYAVAALLVKNQLNAQTHSGQKSLLNLHFIKSGKIQKEYGQLYSDLMDWRQKGDYGDMFDFTKDDIEPLLGPVSDFVNSVKVLIKAK